MRCHSAFNWQETKAKGVTVLGNQGRHYCLGPQSRRGSGAICIPVFFVDGEEGEDHQSGAHLVGQQVEQAQTQEWEVKGHCGRKPLSQESQQGLRRRVPPRLDSLRFGGWRRLPLGQALYKCLRVCRLRTKHLVESVAVSTHFPFLTARTVQGTGNKGVNTLPFHDHDRPTPRANLGLPLGPPVSAFTLALCTCQTPTHVCTHTPALTHAHTYSQMPAFLSESTREAE